MERLSIEGKAQRVLRESDGGTESRSLFGQVKPFLSSHLLRAPEFQLQLCVPTKLPDDEKTL
jgi:hypothetical protein